MRIRPEVQGSAAEADAVGTPFADANPRREVPVLLVDEETPIFDSPVILDYIETRFPDPPLLPADPLGRARARMTESICDAQYQAVNWARGEVLWFGRATGTLADHLRAVARRDTDHLPIAVDQRGSDAGDVRLVARSSRVFAEAPATISTVPYEARSPCCDWP